jgi:MFS family permease
VSMASRSPPRKRPETTVWRNGDFLRLWTSETISLFGTHITALALPLAAVLTLDATAAEVGILNAARFVPFVAVTLFAGVWVDRYRRRPILTQANLGRALLIGLVPLGAYLGYLRMEYLYAVALLVGILTVFFDLAYQAYLPSLVSREELTDANSKLQASASAAEAGGPGLGGVLVHLLTAPYALLVDAVSYLVSALTLSTIRRREPDPDRNSAPPAFAAIRAGFAFMLRNRYLRPIAGEAASFNLFEQAILTVFVIYAVRELDLSVAVLGVIVSTGAVGAVLGSLLAAYPARRFGLGPTIVGSMALACTAPLLLPVAGGHGSSPVVLPMLAFFFYGVGLGVSGVHAVTLRQAITPDRIFGRVNASYRFFTYGAIPLGALFGGFLATAAGLRLALLVSAVGLVTSLAWVVFSPVTKLRTMPDQQ